MRSFRNRQYRSKESTDKLNIDHASFPSRYTNYFVSVGWMKKNKNKNKRRYMVYDRWYRVTGEYFFLILLSIFCYLYIVPNLILHCSFFSLVFTKFYTDVSRESRLFYKGNETCLYKFSIYISMCLKIILTWMIISFLKRHARLFRTQSNTAKQSRENM